MTWFTRQQRALIWLAFMATMLGALMPTVSRMLSANASAGLHATSAFTEICTSTGMQWVQLDSAASNTGDQSGDTQPAGDHLGNHCPYCLHTADPTLATNPATPHGVAQSPSLGSNAAYLSPPPPKVFVSSAAPRGPPKIS